MSGPAIVADTDDVQGLSVQFTLAANHAGDVADAVNRGIGLADLIVSAALDPAGAARFEATALALLTGPLGARVLEQRFAAIGRNIVYAAEDYARTDLAVATFDVRLAVALPAAIEAAASAYRAGRGFEGAGTAFLGKVDPVLVNTATPLLSDLIDSYGAALPTDGRAHVRDVGPGSQLVRTPGTVTDLVTNLVTVADNATVGAGDIQLQIVSGTDAAGRAQRRVFVYLPGTDDSTSFNGSNVKNEAADVTAVAGRMTAYEQGVLAAMRSAGVTVTDDVTLVGHSEGGMVAVNTARDAISHGEFNITHIVTLGSPIGIDARELPASTRLLAIENHNDVVPQLDGVANPSGSNIATVRVNQKNTTSDSGAFGQHALHEAYLPAVADLDASGNAAVKSFTDSIGGELRGAQVRTTQYSITRDRSPLSLLTQ